jgi:acetyl-CoA hydrolase
MTKAARGGQLGSRLGDLVRDGDTILVSAGAGEPKSLIHELVELGDKVKGVTVIQVMTGSEEALADASGGGFRLRTPMPGPKSRKAIAEGRADLVLTSMGQLCRAIETGRLRIDGVFVGAGFWRGSPTFGPAVDVLPVAWPLARFRAVELNHGFTRVPCPSLPLREADLVVEADWPPVLLQAFHANAEAIRIGEYVAGIVEDGATVEIGVGQSLAGVAPALGARRRSLTLHSGLVGDDLMILAETGAIETLPDREVLGRGTVLFGSKAFHEWIYRTSRAALIDSREAQAISSLMALPKFTAINGALEIDLMGQVNTIGAGGRIVGGIAGILDFAFAGSLGAASIIAIESRRRDGTPKIVRQTSPITLAASLVTHVVTEFGIADLRGKSISERADCLVRIAHPDDRADLAAS